LVSATSSSLTVRSPRLAARLVIGRHQILVIRGFVNNLNDGLTWGVFPLLFASRGLGLAAIGLTAMVYPALIASVADHTHPAWRAQGLAVYRFWRDLGHAADAVVAGLIAGAFGLSTTVLAGGALTLASGLLAARWITSSRHP